MSNKRYPNEFKIEAVKQVVEYDHSVASVAKRLGATTHSLYAWFKKFGPDSSERAAAAAEQAEIKRLNKELKRVTEERDILKKPRRTSPISRSEVRLHQRAEQTLPRAPSVSVAGCSSQWLLCLAQAAALSTQRGERAAHGTYQAVLARKRRGLWLPQDLFGSARTWRRLWQEPGSPIDACSRPQGTGWLSPASPSRWPAQCRSPRPS